MITYPFTIPSGVGFVAYVSGTNNMGTPSGTMNSIYANNFIGKSGTLNALSTTTLNATTISGSTITAGILNVSGISYLGLSNAAVIDFGSVPTLSASFTISNPSVSVSNNITISPAAKETTGRTADDWWWDIITMSAFAGSGSITIYAKTENGSSVMGTRSILYTIS